MRLFKGLSASKFKYSIHFELTILCLAILLTSSLGIGLFSFFTAKAELELSGQIILENGVKMAKEAINQKVKMVALGVQSLPEAQEDIKEFVLGPKNKDGTRPINRTINLGKNGYIFILSRHADEIAHPSIEGQNTWLTKDMSGRDFYVAQDIIDKALHGGGFTYYSWKYPYTEQIVPKVAYAEYDPNWDWIIVSSTYMDDFNSGAYRILAVIAYIFLALLAFGLILIYWISRHISRPLKTIANTMSQFDVVQSNYPIITLKQKNEIGLLAKSFNQMARNLTEEYAKRIATENELMNSTKSLNDSMIEKECMYDELLLSKEKFQKVFQHAADAIGLIRFRDGEFLEVNDAFYNILGFKQEQVIGHTSEEFELWEENEQRSEMYERLNRDERIENLITVWRTAEGLLRTGLLSLELIEIEGDRCIIFVWHDYTDRKAVEDALQLAYESLEIKVEQRTVELAIEKDRAEAASKAKSVFLANISHELRTPLNAILGFSQIMARDSKFPEVYRDKLNIILNSGDHLLNLINNVLDLARIESGRNSFESKDFDIGSMLNEIILMLKMKAEAKGIDLFLDQSSSFPRFVNTDPVKLRQVIINIAGNAVKFTKEGHVSIKLSLQSHVSEEHKLILFFEISDTGPGIPTEDLERIFSPFEQSTASSDTASTGLGLAIAREYINMLGGSVTVASEAGKGTTFRFTVTCEAVNAEGIEGITQGKSFIAGFEGADRFRLLIVEDNAENRLFLKQLLAPHGFQLSMAENGFEAIALAQELQPHLILMDRRMPFMDGLQATEEIRRMELLPEPKIIAVTAHAYAEEQKEMLDAGCDAFIRKPVREQELFQTIGTLLGIECHYAREMSDAAPSERMGERLAANATAQISGELKDALRQAVLEADLDEMLVLIGKLEEIDLHMANVLKGMAQRYEYEAILKELD